MSHNTTYNISVSDARDRIVKKGQTAMAPRYIWLFTEPLALSISSIMIIFGYISFILKHYGLQSAIDDIPMVSKLIVSIFGSVETLYSAVVASFYWLGTLPTNLRCFLIYPVKQWPIGLYSSAVLGILFSVRHWSSLELLRSKSLRSNHK